MLQSGQTTGSVRNIRYRPRCFIWLVVEPPPKNILIRLDHHPNYWGSHRSHVPVATNQNSLLLFNIAMENGPFIVDFPIKTSIYKGFSMAMFQTTNQL